MGGEDLVVVFGRQIVGCIIGCYCKLSVYYNSVGKVVQQYDYSQYNVYNIKMFVVDRCDLVELQGVLLFVFGDEYGYNYIKQCYYGKCYYDYGFVIGYGFYR